jgi:hypothetical protein
MASDPDEEKLTKSEADAASGEEADAPHSPGFRWQIVHRCDVQTTCM